MADQEQLDILKQGVEIWNQWRREHPSMVPDLSFADLTEVDLDDADLSGADFSDANLREAQLGGANLRGANFSRTNLIKADMWRANLSEAVLYRAKVTEADLSQANLSDTNLSEAELDGVDFTKAELIRATLVKTNCPEAILTNCRVYGISAWNVQLDRAKQENLVITDYDEPTIMVDNLKIAQFIYLLLNNEEIRDAIDTIAKKAVLILGRFTFERKVVLDNLREELRTCGSLPILFDFEKPSSRSITETVRTLAHLARFIIADLTDPSSIPQELQAIIPTLAIPVQPVLLEGKREYSMFVDFLKTYHWVLPIHYYTDQTNLLTNLKEQVIEHDMWSYTSLRETHA